MQRELLYKNECRSLHLSLLDAMIRIVKNWKVLKSLHLLINYSDPKLLLVQT